MGGTEGREGLEEGLARAQASVRPAKLRRHGAALLRDAAMLLARVRLCVMIDYVPLPLDKLRALLSMLWSGWDRLMALSVVELDGAVFLVHRTPLLERLEGELRSMNATTPPSTSPSAVDVALGAPPLFVRLDGKGAPRIASQEDVGQLASHLRAFVGALRSGSGSGGAAAGASSSIGWQDLGAEGWGGVDHERPLPLPVLAGWLLEYPLVYVFNPQNGAQAAGVLSNSSLQGYQLWSACGALQRGPCPLLQASEEMMLLSFSVPSEILNHATSHTEADGAATLDRTLEARVQGLQRRMQERSSRAQEDRGVGSGSEDAQRWQWEPPRVVKHLHAPHTVAL